MEKKKSNKKEELENELKDLIEKNESISKGMKKIIQSINNKNPPK
ncbi:hypothetical protein [Aequorivita sp. KMM 9714]|nr:hypothetical protein [Aequorivita sp. KMM 9714]